MDHIASLTADKVNYTYNRLERNDAWYDDEIKRLKGKLAARDKLIVKKDLTIEFYKDTIDKLKNKQDNLVKNPFITK